MIEANKNLSGVPVKLAHCLATHQEEYRCLYDVLRLAHETRDVYSYVRDVKSELHSDGKRPGKVKETKDSLHGDEELTSPTKTAEAVDACMVDPAAPPQEPEQVTVVRELPYYKEKSKNSTETGNVSDDLGDVKLVPHSQDKADVKLTVICEVSRGTESGDSSTSLVQTSDLSSAVASMSQSLGSEEDGPVQLTGSSELSERDGGDTNANNDATSRHVPDGDTSVNSGSSTLDKSPQHSDSDSAV